MTASSRAVPVGALLLAIVAVGAGTGAALARPSDRPIPLSSSSYTSVVAPTETPAPATRTAAPTTVVPAVLDLALEDARAGLLAAGLASGDVEDQDGPSAAGTVLGSDPSPGSTVPLGSAVRLVVASGWTTVPELAGLDPTTARAALVAAGLVVAVDASGPVVGTWPAAGTRVEVGSPVQPLVAPPTPTSEPTPRTGVTAAPTGTPGPVPTATATASPTTT